MQGASLFRGPQPPQLHEQLQQTRPQRPAQMRGGLIAFATDADSFTLPVRERRDENATLGEPRNTYAGDSSR